MRILVCGGRDYKDYKAVLAGLESICKYTGREIELLISGGAKGADKLAERAADELGIPIMVFPAAWTKFGKAAGPRRNGWMLEYGKPNVVLAMPGGNGTKNMMTQAAARHIPIVQKS